jgi:hypothetical protein
MGTRLKVCLLASIFALPNGPHGLFAQNAEDQRTTSQPAANRFWRPRQTGNSQGSAANLRLRALKDSQALTTIAGTWSQIGPNPLQGVNPVAGEGYELMSGQVSAIAVDLANDATGNTVYVGSSSGGLWKSTNGLTGGSFIPLSDQSNSLSVGAIALDSRTNPPKIYVGTGAPDNSANISSYTGVGIRISTNDGKTWTTVGSADSGAHSFVGLGFSRILVDPVNPDILLASTGMGIDPNYPHTSIPQGDGAINNLGIYRSTDGGATWSQVMTANYAGQPACCGTPSLLAPQGFFHMEILYEPKQGTYFAGVTGQGLFASTDQGATWNSLGSLGLGNGLPAGNKMFRVSLTTRNGSLWALLLVNPFPKSGNAFELFRSSDQGGTWRLTRQQLPVTIPASSRCYSNDYDPVFKGALMYVAAPPRSPSLLVATQCVFLWGDIPDPGSSFNLIENNLHGDQHAIAFVNATTWYVGDDGGAWVTTNSGGTWIGLNHDLQTLEFFSADEDSAGAGWFAGGMQDNGPAIVSAPHSSTWQQPFLGDGAYVGADPLGTPAFFMSEPGGDIFYVNTSIVTTPYTPPTLIQFSSASPAINADFLTPFEILTNNPSLYPGVTGITLNIFQQGRILLVGGAANPWLVAFDPAATYNPCNFPNPLVPCNASLPSNPQVVQLTKGGATNISYLALVPSDPTTAYLTAGSSLLRLSNISFTGSATMTPITTGPVNGDVLGHLAVSYSDSQILYLIKVGFLNGQKIFKSTDGGSTWINISGNMPNTPLNWIALDPNSPNSVYVASDTGVYVASDGGVVNEVWKTLGTGLPNVPVVQIKVLPRGGLLAATFGRNVWGLGIPIKPPTKPPIPPPCPPGDANCQL